MQWRAIGQLCGIPFGPLYALFACWTRLGLWRRLLDRLHRTWRRACGDARRIVRVTADGAYEGDPTYQTIAAHDDGIDVVIPPRSTAVPGGEPGLPTLRDRHLAMIAERGQLAWQVAADHGQRALIETTMGRYKTLIGPRLRARGFAAQQSEVAVGVTVLNRMLMAGRPKSVRCQRVIV